MKEKTALLIGATGLIGSQLLEELVKDDYFEKIRLLVRRPFTHASPKVEVVIVDFNNPNDYSNKIGSGETIFSCIGTTNKLVKGDQQAYRKIDFDIPVHAAEFGVRSGFRKFLLVSAVGAKKGSSNFYLNLKGEVEDAIEKFPFESVFIFRPSMLLGNRKEKRPLEVIGTPIMQLFSIFLFGKWSKYKPIHAKQVALAMLRAAKSEERGIVIKEFDSMV